LTDDQLIAELLGRDIDLGELPEEALEGALDEVRATSRRFVASADSLNLSSLNSSTRWAEPHILP
jgi:hypothetical protein